MPRVPSIRGVERLPVLMGLAALWVMMTFASNAAAEQPEELLRLRDSDQSATRADNFDLTAPSDIRFEDRHFADSGRHSVTLEVVSTRRAPSWPSAADDISAMGAPVILHRDAPEHSGGSDLAWGLTGTGASIFTGALLFHLETLQLRGEFERMSPGASAQHHREVRNQIDQTRKIVVALYAVGGSMVTGGVVLLANEEHNGGVSAKLAPAWMNGGPAARIKISF